MKLVGETCYKSNFSQLCENGALPVFLSIRGCGGGCRWCSKNMFLVADNFVVIAEEGGHECGRRVGMSRVGKSG